MTIVLSLKKLASAWSMERATPHKSNSLWSCFTLSQMGMGQDVGSAETNTEQPQPLKDADTAQQLHCLLKQCRKPN
jgi:hypothetical protein